MLRFNLNCMISKQNDRLRLYTKLMEIRIVFDLTIQAGSETFMRGVACVLRDRKKLTSGLDGALWKF